MLGEKLYYFNAPKIIFTFTRNLIVRNTKSIIVKSFYRNCFFYVRKCVGESCVCVYSVQGYSSFSCQTHFFVKISRQVKCNQKKWEVYFPKIKRNMSYQRIFVILLIFYFCQKYLGNFLPVIIYI